MRPKAIRFGAFLTVAMLLDVVLSFPIGVFAQNPEWVDFTSGSQIFAVAVEGEYVWVGGDGLVKFNRKTGEKERFTSMNSGIPSHFVTDIAIDSSGNKWIVTYSCGLANFDGENWTIYNETNSGLPTNAITDVCVDPAGALWIAT